MIEIRFALPEDVPLVREFIFAIAEYEQLASECFATEEKLMDAFFGAKPSAEVLLAYCDAVPAGFAIFFHNFSSFLAQRGLYLEDLFVKPEFRRQGIGSALFHRLGQIAYERKCARFEWTALDWNTPAIAFYQRMGARAMSEWTTFRLEGEGLKTFAGQAAPPRP